MTPLAARDEHLEVALSCFEDSLPVLRLIDPPRSLGTLATTGRLQLALGRSSEAATTWHEALALRETLLMAATRAEVRGQAALRSRDLGADLARLEVSLGRYGAAVEVLERSRALGLRAALGLDDAWLAALSDEPRRAVVSARERLSSLRPTGSGLSPLAAETFRTWEAEVVSAEAELAEALRSAGFSATPALGADAMAALAPPGGALVLLAVGAEAGLAMILVAGQALGAKHAILLPDVTSASVRALRAPWDDAHRELLAATARAGAGGLSFPMDAALAANEALEATLEALGRTVMNPVVERLADLGVASGAELVLLPQGDLALLPLHAAFSTAGKARRAVIDDYVVRYAPGAYALRTAQARLAQWRATDAKLGFFGAFNPMKGTRQALRLAETEELPALRDLFMARGYPVDCCVGQASGDIETPPATVERVVARAGAAGYVHLACHGHFDAEDPEASGLQLAGGERLTVPMIIQTLGLNQCRLVTLSACDSGKVDVDQLPDEFIGLPAAFLQAGAAGVVATFWSILDSSATAVMSTFYALHLDDRDASPAAALRRAVLRLRESGSIRPGGDRHRNVEIGEQAAAEPTPTAKDVAPNVRDSLHSLPLIWAAFAHHGI